MSVRSEAHRLAYLDGLRGLAALVVVLMHLMATYFPSLIFASAANAPGWHTVLATTPLSFLVSGQLAVIIFFVLSGYVLSASAINSRQSVIALTLTRLLRLGVPASLSVVFAYALYVAGFLDLQGIPEATGHPWAEQFMRPISSGDAASEMLGSYFLTGGSSLNGVLWTMRIELIGSIIVYVVFGFMISARLRVGFLIALTMAFLILGGGWIYLVGFTAGMLLYESRTLRAPNSLLWWCLASGLLLGGFPFEWRGHPIYGPALIGLHSYYSLADPAIVSRTVGAILVVTAVLHLRPMHSALEIPPIKFLGRVSFPLYLLHWPLMQATFTEPYFYLRGSPVQMILAVVVFLAALFALSWLMVTAVDQPLLRWLRQLRHSISPWSRLPFECSSLPRDDR